jgi:NitT/TauT family transport system substrate-binding protein
MTRVLRTRNPLRALAVALGVCLVAGGCSKSPNAGKAAGKPGVVAIRFATDWRPEAEQGGFYEALATGEYARRGLNVTIIPGDSGSNVPQLLATGAADLGIGSNSFGVLNLAAEHVPVRAVMASFQKDPQVLMAHANGGVASLADLKGHPILISDAAITSFWPWLKAKYGVTDAQVRKYTFDPAPFLANPQAVQEGYVTSEPYTIQKATGVAPRVFLLADQGYPGYAAMVLAPDRLITSDARAVQAFVEASAIGWKQYLEGDPSPADALILKANPEMTEDVLSNARAKMRAYGLVTSGDAQTGGVGAMTDAGWKRFFDMAVALGVYPKTLDYHAAYTTAFTATLPFVAMPKARTTAGN